MRVDIKLFAAAAEAVGQAQVSLEVPPPAQVAQLRHQLVETYPRLAPLAGHLLFAVNERLASESTPLAEGDDVACLPPPSGG